MKRTCVVCARVIEISQGPRCPEHAKPKVPRDRQYREMRALILANASHCGICGEGPREGDAWVLDHITPRAHGGSHEPSNLQAAHRSRNGRKGQGLGEEWSP